MKKTIDPRSVLARRAFLKKAGLILGAASIAPLNAKGLYRLLEKTVLTDAYGADPSYDLDFMVEIAIGASFPFGDLFPPHYFLNPNVDPAMGSTWTRAEMRSVNLSNGRRLNFTNAALAMLPFADNIAHFESMREQIGAHPPWWSLRIGGHPTDRQDSYRQTMGSSLSPLFAHMVAARRGANAPAIPGMERGDLNNARISYGTSRRLPNFVLMQPGSSQIQQLFATRPTVTSNSELRRIIEAIKEINSHQADAMLRLRMTGADGAKQASDQGLALITTSRVIDIVSEYNSLANEFFAGAGQDNVSQPNDPNERYNPADRQLGEQLLKLFLGFKYNLMGAGSIHIGLGHPHFAIPQLGDNSVREGSKYIGDRLGAFLAAARRTPHPFRAGRTVFDNLMVVMSSDTQRDVTMYSNDNGERQDNFHWGEDHRKGAVLIGGLINGGYLGDCPYPNGGQFNVVEGFDFNTGATNAGSRPSPNMVYKSIAMAAKIPQADIQAQMGAHFNTGTIPTLFR